MKILETYYVVQMPDDTYYAVSFLGKTPFVDYVVNLAEAKRFNIDKKPQAKFIALQIEGKVRTVILSIK